LVYKINYFIFALDKTKIIMIRWIIFFIIGFFLGLKDPFSQKNIASDNVYEKLNETEIYLNIYIDAKNSNKDSKEITLENKNNK